MQPRQSIIEIFSSFVQFDGDRFSRWAIESGLRRSMQSCLQQIPQETSEYFWTLYWYKFWQIPESQSLAQQHLTAYLQESCYWTSQKTTASFSSTQYKLSDCFQVAIAQVDKVLTGFNPNHSSTLKNYASIIFGSVIRETLRQRQEVDICTDWGLLRKLSQKRLGESLQNAGLSPTEIRAYIQAWNCFKMLYIPTKAANSRQLSRPDDSIWETNQFKIQNSKFKIQNSKFKIKESLGNGDEGDEGDDIFPVASQQSTINNQQSTILN